MVIVNDKVGQLANRLFENSFLLANAIEHGYWVINPHFEEYQHLFVGTKGFNNKITNSRLIVFKNDSFVTKAFQRFLQKLSRIKIRWLEKILCQVIIENEAGRGGGGQSYNLNNEYFVEKAKNKIVLLQGAWYDDNENFQKHAEIIRQIFTPIRPVRSIAENLIKQIRQPKKQLIGIHIRRGDYKDFLGGKYFFDDAFYYQEMLEIQQQLLDKGEMINFLIVSNETIDIKNFPELDVHFSGQHFLVDLHALSLCDYILGPLSTFSRWASFYGRVKLLQLENEKTPDINDFTIIYH